MILCKIWGNVNMRKKFWLPAVLIILILLTGCGNKTSSVNGVFRAVNPPEDTGETVIKELSFDKDKVTMISDDIRQTVDYNIKDGKFTIMTKYGDFSYDYEKKDENTITIDNIDYVKE